MATELPIPVRDRKPRRRTLGARAWRSPLVALSLSLFGLLPACQELDAEAARGAGSGIDGGADAGVTIVGESDTPANAEVSLTEGSLTGTIASGKLRLSAELRSVASQRATGSLKVRITDVPGSTDVSAAALAYDVPAGGSATAKVDIDAPEKLEKQSDLVRYSVRIDDGKPGGLSITRSLLYVVPPVDVRLEGPATVTRGKTVRYRVTAEDRVTRAAVAGVPVSVVLSKDGKDLAPIEATTGSTGDAVVEVKVDEAGAYAFEAVATANTVNNVLSDSVSVQAPGPKLLVTTDKPIYKPGQTIHLRALALARGDNTPVAQQAARLEVEDGKGNKIFKKSVTTDAYGIAQATFAIGAIVNMGTFKTRVTLGEATSEKAVTVSEYALPKFGVEVKTEKPWYRPGATVTGTIDARYFFGKAVGSGNVVIEASSLDVGTTLFEKVMGKLDAQGHYQFSVTLPSVLTGIPLEQGKAVVALHVTVTDTAGQEVARDATLTISPDGVSMSLVPEQTQIVPGVENVLYGFVTDPLGGPIVGAAVNLYTPDDLWLPATSDEFGQVTFNWLASSDLAPMFTMDVKPAGGTLVSSQFSFGAQSGSETVLVRTDKPVYRLGDTVQVDIRLSGGKNVYVDWLNDGQTVDMRTVEVKDGKASFTMDVGPDVIGSNRIEAYVVDDDGNVVRAGRTIFARGDTALSVSLSTDKTVYAPGTPAKLTFSVKDESGSPKVAALGVQIVDQAVFALVDAQPGLLRTYFELEDRFSTPTYEIGAPPVDFGTVLFESPDDARKAKARDNLTAAGLAALGRGGLTGIQRSSWPTVESEVVTNLAGHFTAAKKGLVAALDGLADRVAAELQAEGCASTDCVCNGVNRATTLADRIQKQLVTYDFWGNPYALSSSGYSFELKSSGPDERAGTTDDQLVSVTYQEIGLSPYCNSGGFVPGELGTGGAATASGGWGNTDDGAGGVGGAGAASGAAGASDPGGGEPRVRRDFPETLYVNPAVITGPDGTATLDVDLADSITEWRVSALANSSDGRLGGSESGITVFQDFFADIDFPATLTRGDEVTFPVAVYNYLDTPQTVSLELSAADWYTPLGSTTQRVELAAGQVMGVSFPVRVEKVGMRTLTVTARGTEKSDAIARTVRVAPDGKPIATAISGLLEPGAATHSVDVPAGAIEGSSQLYVEIYPAFLAQVVKGMDSMLAEPSGCFEQTTSTTWPNVLVLAYMQKTKQLTTEIQMKAESLISAGYQRLLTFEHPGGGFSWFGTQDPAPFLSVTAFGLMEFADMAEVATVDDSMVERTRQWMLGQQQADGSWLGDTSEFFTFQTSTVRNTAFVIWALASGGYDGPELASAAAYVKSHLASETLDAYSLALVANALELAAPDDPATAKVYQDLLATKKVSGEKISWDSGDTQTCFYGSGNDAQTTATALALHALLLRGGNADAVAGALKTLASAKDANGNFGSTQATVWSLRALLLAASKGTEGAVGTVDVLVDGKAAQTVTLAADKSDVMTTVDLSTLAIAGTHAVELDFAGTGKVSYNVVSKYNIPWSGASDPQDGPLALTVRYDKTTLYVNDTVTETLTVENRTAATQNMILATIGVPPGFEVATADLQAYLDSKVLSKYELTGKQLVLYLSTLGPGAIQAFTFQLRANLPVKASDGGGEVHLYYEPDKSAHAPAGVLEATGG